MKKLVFGISAALILSGAMATASCSYISPAKKSDDKDSSGKVEKKDDKVSAGKDDGSDSSKKSDDKKDSSDKKDDSSKSDDSSKDSKSKSGGPSNLPEDVPFYSGGKVDSESSKDNNYTLRYTAKASTDTVSGFYKKELERMGWKIQASVSIDVPILGGSIAPLSAKKGERTCSVAVSGKNDNECSVDLAVSKK